MESLTLSPKKQKATLIVLTILRIAIGWHFLYEGLVKLFSPLWTSAGYLQSATGPLAGFFHILASSETSIEIINYLNIFGLILVGLGLMLGFLTKLSQAGGIILLVLYYLSHPPVFSDPGFFREGSYLIVSKDFLEIIALIVLMFIPTGKFLGLDGLIERYFSRPMHKMDHGQPDIPETKADRASIKRREVLKHMATFPFLGAVVYGAIKKTRMESLEEQNLVDASSGATERFVKQIQAGSNSVALKDLKGKKFTDETSQLKGTLPTGMLGNLESSKLILGGNLLSGYVHSRDLIYVSSLVLHYHQKDRIFRTLMLAEQSGVNTLLSNPVVMPLMREYWDEGYGNIKFISDCAGLEYSNGPQPMNFQKYLDIVKDAIDNGIHSGYIQGETADYYIEHGEVEKIVKVMDLLKENNLPVGIGAHKISTIKKCVDLGLENDYWMKTMHSHNYWSAKHPTWHDNMYCFDPDETERFMEGLEKPWIAFKTMAAGSLHPREAFPYAFEKGADFICAGMYDFQIIDDVNITLSALENVKNRKRPWRA